VGLMGGGVNVGDVVPEDLPELLHRLDILKPLTLAQAFKKLE